MDIRLLPIALFLALGTGHLAEAAGPAPAPSPAPAFDSDPFPEDQLARRLNFGGAQLGGVFASQGGGTVYSFVARYLPEMRLKGSAYRFSIGLDLGYSILQNQGSKEFSVIEYGGNLIYRFDERWRGRVLFGGQTWASSPQVSALFAGAEFEYHFSADHQLIDSMFIAYTPVFQTVVAHEISAGIGLQF